MGDRTARMISILLDHRRLEVCTTGQSIRGRRTEMHTLGSISPIRVIEWEDSYSFFTLFLDTTKEFLFGSRVLVDRFVIVEMFGSDIGQDADTKRYAIKSILIESMRAGLYDRVRTSTIYCLFEYALEI